MYSTKLSGSSSRDRCGGKAAQLARAQAAGARVPRTLVIERSALRRALEGGRLRAEIEGYLAAFSGGSTSRALAERHRRIARSLRSASLPLDLEESILDAARSLLTAAPAGLAVRSSAVYEDSAAASFAGVFESYLGITDPDEILARVLDCWSSSWAPRALRYLARMGIEPRLDAMAVILQPVLPARAAGVLYTADAKTGNPWEFVVHATAGLAADLMSGSGRSDRFRLDWENGATLECEPLEERPALGEASLVELARAARHLDEVFGSRLDMEWVLGPDGIWIVQVRPLVALPEFFPFEPSEGEKVWKQPMFVLPLRSDQPQNLLTPLYRDLSESELWYRYQPEDVVLTGIWTEELDLHGHRFVAEGPQPTFLDHFEDLADCEPWLETNEPRYRERWERRHDELDALRRVAGQALEATTTSAQLVPTVFEARDLIWDLNSFGWSGPQALGWMCEGLLRTTFERHDLHVRTAEVVAGGEDSYTFAVTHSLQQLAKGIREEEVVRCFAEEDLGRIVPRLCTTARDCDFLRLYEEHCWRFGRTPPSWRGRPAFWAATFDQGHEAAAMHTIRSALRGESRDVVSQQRQQGEERERSTRRLWTMLADKGPVLRQRVERMLGWTRYWTQALNDRHGLGAGLLWERELIWELGSRLRSEGAIDRPEDVLLFTREDLETAGVSGDGEDLRRLYVERRSEYRRNRRLVSPAVLGRSVAAVERPAPSVAAAAGPQRVFEGVGLSRGQATGVARQVRELDTDLLDSLRPDHVLLLPHENAFAYADWHSLLTLVRGVVSPGRPAHHISQVARECGVPLVGHVRGEVGSIPDGAVVQVNADDGTVRILDPGARDQRRFDVGAQGKRSGSEEPGSPPVR